MGILYWLSVYLLIGMGVGAVVALACGRYGRGQWLEFLAIVVIHAFCWPLWAIASVR